MGRKEDLIVRVRSRRIWLCHLVNSTPDYAARLPFPFGAWIKTTRILSRRSLFMLRGWLANRAECGRLKRLFTKRAANAARADEPARLSPLTALAALFVNMLLTTQGCSSGAVTLCIPKRRYPLF